jgi:hypothetical protein
MKEQPSGLSPQEAIRRHVEVADDWEWQEIASQLYIWTDRFNDRFFQREMPTSVLSFERMDYRVLAAYTLRRNAQGLLYEISFNVKHLDRPLWATLETLMHEYMHLWQQNHGQSPVTRNYHNDEFVSACEVIGLHPAIGSGVHLRPADGVFAQFLRVYGVPEPEPLEEPKTTPKGRPLDWWADPEKRPVGRSTMRKWSCGCQIVRVGTKEFHAQCLMCGNTFAPVDPQKARESNRRQAKPTSDSGWEQGELDLDQKDVDTAHEDIAPADDEQGADVAGGADYGALPSPS